MVWKNKLKICYILIFSCLGILGWFHFSSNLAKEDFIYVSKKSNSQLAIDKELKQPVTSVVAELTETVSLSSLDKQPIVSSDDKLIIQDVPFSPQAPFGEWSDPRQEDGCEEMAAIMAMRWVNQKTLTKEEAKKELLALSAWQTEKYKTYIDTSAQDTAERIFKGYYNYDKVKVVYDIDIVAIKKEIIAGRIVIVPLDGRAIKNPFYTRGGPERHMLLIKGYDPVTKEFITNDAGTRRGENYRYGEGALINAVRDYPTGNHIPITESRRAMIVIYPK
jgi:hypothetical protein